MHIAQTKNLRSIFADCSMLLFLSFFFWHVSKDPKKPVYMLFYIPIMSRLRLKMFKITQFLLYDQINVQAKKPHVEERCNMATIFRLGHAIRPAGLLAANTRSAELERSVGQLLEKYSKGVKVSLAAGSTRSAGY